MWIEHFQIEVAALLNKLYIFEIKHNVFQIKVSFFQIKLENREGSCNFINYKL